MGSVLLPQTESSHSYQSTSRALLGSSSEFGYTGVNYVRSSLGPQGSHAPSASARRGECLTHGQRSLIESAGHRDYRISSVSTSSHQSAISLPRLSYAPREPCYRANAQPRSEQDDFADRNQSYIRLEQGVQRDTGNSNSRSLSFTSILREKNTRRRLVTLTTSALFLILALSLYFAFTVSKSHLGHELHILLIFMILILAIVFFHSLIRFSMVTLRGSRSTMAMNRIPSRAGPTGYVQPERPIHVILAGDEETLTQNNGASREKVTPPPPAYGLWRSSVRLNPDLLYWHRVDGNAPSLPQHVNKAQGSGGKVPLPRPPSYTSDNGIDYVIEAQPRSLTQGPSAEWPGRQ
ncbi:hypothetical protein ANOM_001807 [Aspergillus nomiae NRRL 13137]|uniref:Uncharacterized protein n=1 Tax=Aspergillus nomiae NRRL (strain ATCC 15546 / NRRL 13137 / CBS 260.88 / M93) TaxID=1509407 RepID=A0A0L1JEQ1_ASPN3|nr:uncharacterized protein ANOM_001807 [Aspergillus nomiae NRRL 13137]KNG90299.1 hypothetical protein ANOM_001807 [Aspergillus nomiae NRRL 13137]